MDNLRYTPFDAALVLLDWDIKIIKPDTIDFCGYALDSSCVHVLVDIIQQNAPVRNLNLSRCNIKSIMMKSIFSALSQNTTIHELCLDESEVDYTQFDANCIDALADMLLTNTTLQSLSLNDNNLNLNDDTLTKLISNIAANTTLKKLELVNCNIDLHDAQPIANLLLINHSLKVLDLGCNDISSLQSITNALSSNTSLRDLHLSGNNLDNTSIQPIIHMLNTNYTLKKLYINNNNHTITDIKSMLSSLNNQSLTYLDIDNKQISYTHISMASLHNILKTNYTLTYFRPTTPEISKILDRNMSLTYASIHRNLLDFTLLFLPLIHTHPTFDPYCMLYIFDYTNIDYIHIHHYKKITLVINMYKYYRTKIIRDQTNVIANVITNTITNTH